MKLLGSVLFVLLAFALAVRVPLINGSIHFESAVDATPQTHIATSTPRIMVATTSSKKITTTTLATSTQKKLTTPSKKVVAKVTEPTQVIAPPAVDPNAALRIQNPYPFAPESFTKINDDVRGALVNILCSPREGGMRPTSGSGVIIDPRGVILTNAHVAQYVLLSESKNIDLSCLIRTGSPAVPKWRAEVLYIPPAWVDKHASEIVNQHAYGTGEHDYALLLITGSSDSQVYTTYPSLSTDTRHAIGFEGDPILVASYPAELVGGFATQSNLYAASSQTTIQKLLTFVAQTVDLISLGGIIEAQSGSSGGAVVNAWDRLIGLIVTTSAGDTTGERDLRALTLSYIDRDLAAQTGHNLSEILSGDVTSLTANFTRNVAPDLIQKYIDILTSHSQ